MVEGAQAWSTGKRRLRFQWCGWAEAEAEAAAVAEEEEDGKQLLGLV